MKPGFKYILGAILISLCTIRVSIAEPPLVPMAQFERTGVIESIDLPSKKIRINGVEYLIADQAIVYSSNTTQPATIEGAQLRRGMRIGIKTTTAKPGEMPQITAITVYPEQ